jgi:hypothetical protein
MLAAWMLAVTAAAATEIPFDFKTRQPIVAVRVNGGEAVPFVVDTGASVNVVDAAVARDAGVTGEVAPPISGGGEAAAPARRGDGLTLETGAVRWEGQRATIVPLGYPGAKHFAGFIGSPILSRHAVQFDFAARVVRLIDPARYEPPPGAVRVPFELQHGLPVVEATVDLGGGPIAARLMIDTGAGSTFVDLNRPFVDAHGLLENAPGAEPTRQPAGIGGSLPIVHVQGRRVVLGGIPFDRPRIGLSRATRGSSARSGRDGIIGNVLLERFVVTVDYGRRTLVLEDAEGRPR